MRKFLLGLALSLIVSLGFANDAVVPLPSEQAFVFTTYVDDHDNIIFQWNIAPGYYLYQNKFNFSVSPLSDLKIGKIDWPVSRVKQDDDGNAHPVYSGLLKLTIPLLGPFRGPIVLKINYQGCSMSGFCYAPVAKYLRVNLSTIKPFEDLTKNVSMTSVAKPFLPEENTAARIFATHGIFITLLSFLGLGLLLAFTPCVLPMVPILSGIIVGHHRQVSTARAFSLSLAYVTGMAMTYAVAGMGAAFLGSSVQTLFQQTWVIVLFSSLFVLLSLSLFGFYELQMPSFLHRHTTQLSHRLQGGSYVGVFLMGCLSTLIVSPCVSAPLVGVLAYISQTGNVVFGGMALLMLGIGMGIPLLVIGTSAGKWLPKAGHWMDLIKKLFGVILLGVAIWMLSRIVPGSASLFLWSALVLGTGLYFGLLDQPLDQGRLVLRTVASFLLVYGMILFVGAMMGYSDPFGPWGNWHGESQSAVEMHQSFFYRVNDNRDLDLQLANAKRDKKPVIVDFYATWCTSCIMLDRHVFNQSIVQNKLADFVRLRVDVTKNNPADHLIMQRYHVIAPPTILFFNKEGDEVVSQRVIGELSVSELENKIMKIKEDGRGK